MTVSPSLALIAQMRDLAARGEEFMLVVYIGERAVPFFKDQIDAAQSDQQLIDFIKMRFDDSNTPRDIA